MKNINNIYHIAVIKNLSQSEISFTAESLTFLKSKGFKVIASHARLIREDMQDEIIHELLSSFMLAENVALVSLDIGAYIINIDTMTSIEKVTPITFKARKILNAELLDIYAHRKREVYYSEYLAVEEIIALMRNRTDYLEEKLFIRVHQINELAMN